MAVSEFAARQAAMLEVEKEVEIQRTVGVLYSHTEEELAKKGIVLLDLILESKAPTKANRVSVTLKGLNETAFPMNSFARGNCVGVYSDSFRDPPVATGVVDEITNQFVVILINDGCVGAPIVAGGIFKLGPVYDDTPHERLLMTLDELRESSHNLVRMMFPDRRAPRILTNDEVLEPCSTHYNALNIAQQAAVAGAINGDVLTVIHGPPGTGKTRTLCITIFEYLMLNPDSRILVCAPSNVGVDNLAMGLLNLMSTHEQESVRMVRFGHPSRIGDEMHDRISLDYLMRTGPFGDVAASYQVKISSIIEREKRIVSDEALTDQARYKELTRIRDELVKTKKELAHLEAEAIRKLLRPARVFFATCAGASCIQYKMGLDNSVIFDLCVVDECAQGLEVTSWNPILQAERIILAGDHLQLPPTVLSNQVELQVSLFERAIETYDSFQLQVQYRMNEVIMGWSNTQFYEGNLVAHESVANWILEGGQIPEFHILRCPLVVCDTSDTIGMDEVWRGGRFQGTNPGEVALVSEYILKVIGGCFPIHSTECPSISVLSPYKGQINLLRAQFPTSKYPNIRVATVDSFQGQESDIVIMSLVRANEKNNIGFLRDYRRMNVAVTRAKKQLVIVGNGKTFVTDPVLVSLFDHAHTHGAFIAPTFLVKVYKLESP